MKTAAIVVIGFDAAKLQRFEALRERLHGPSHDALTCFLLVEGLKAIEARLDAAEAEAEGAGR